MIAAFNLPGSIFMTHVWWYAFTVLRPAQLLKRAGIRPLATQDIGRMPFRSPSARSGQYFCRRHRDPVLLDRQPSDYDLVEEFDHISESYEWVVAPFAQPVFHEVSKVVRELTTDESRVLDCSCGPGTDVLSFSKLVPRGEVVGSDLAARMVEVASERAKAQSIDNVSFFQADVSKLPKRFASKFDLTYCALAFHHYPQPRQAVEQMFKSLKAGGHALVVDAGPWWMKALASPLARVGDPGWVAFRTGKEFEALFADAGFREFYWTEVLPGVGLSIGTK